MNSFAAPIGAARKWATLGICCLAVLVLAIDLTALHLAIPNLIAGLRTSGTQILWIADVYGFALAGLLVTVGGVGDRIGRKKLLLVGTAAFAGVSALTAYASSPEMLIAARALLGIAGATIMPSTPSLTRNVFTEAGHSGVMHLRVGVGLAIGVVGLVAFIWRQNRLAEPLIDVRLFRDAAGVPVGAGNGIRDSIGSALQTAATLPARLAGQVTGASQRAFVDGMHVSVLCSAGLAALTGLAALFTLRGVPKVIPEHVEEADEIPGAPTPAR